MDLTIPPTAAPLGKFNRFGWDTSSFALYSLVETTKETIDVIATILIRDWWSEPGIGLEGGGPLVQAAPEHDFNRRPLRDVLEAHIRLVEHDVQTASSSADEIIEGWLRWFPTAFVILTSNDIREEHLLFVYADSYNETVACPLRKFYFKVGDSEAMLSALRMGHMSCTDAETTYAIPLGETS